MLSLEQAIAKIKEKSGLSDEEIESKIKAKMDQFSGLVSKQGAAHIVANELKIKLIEVTTSPSKLKVNNLIAGMQSVEILTKVLAVYPLRQFNSNGRDGQLRSVVLGDETGNTRAVFWNEQANQLENIKKGDVIKLTGAYVKEDRDKSPELHVNDRSALAVNPPEETVEAANLSPLKKLGDIKEDDSWIDAIGTVTEVFDLKFFEICDQCGRRARPDDKGEFICATHNSVTPKYSYLINVVLDDGTVPMQAVFFREVAQQFLKKTDEELLSLREIPEAFEETKSDMLGSFVKVSAKVNKNEMFNRIELSVNYVEEARPEDVQQQNASETPVSSDGASQNAVKEENVPTTKIGETEDKSESLSGQDADGGNSANPNPETNGSDNSLK